MNKPSPKRKKATSTSSNNSEPAVNPKSLDFSPQDNQDLVTIEVAAVEVPELTEQEQSFSKPKSFLEALPCGHFS